MSTLNSLVIRRIHGNRRDFHPDFSYSFMKASEEYMSLFRVVIAIILPPLAVLDKGCGAILIVTLLTLAGWVPGVLGAILFSTHSHR